MLDDKERTVILVPLTTMATAFWVMATEIFFFLNVVDEEIVQKYVTSMDVTKPSGITNLNNRLLCDAFIVLICELTALFNESIIQELFPQDWKQGTITPIPKSGNLMEKTNWRPITILNTFGKLLEKIIHYQTSIYFKI